MKFNYEKVLIFFILFMCFLPYWVNANIICNDGTVSSGCSDCYQGCCSRHGGCTAGGSSSSYGSVRKSSKTKSSSSSSIAKTTKKVVPAIVKKSSNNKIRKVVIDGKEIPLSKSMNYTTINEEVSISVELESSKASAKYNRNIKLNHGDNMEEIIVTAENGSKAVYKINIKLLSSNTQLSEVLVNNSNVSVSHNMNCDSAEDVAIIKIIPEDPNTKLDYEEKKNLEVGDNIVNIKAIAENGEIEDYKLTIKYEKFGIVDYIATTTVLGGATAGICYAVNKGKKTKKNNSNKESYIECNSCHKLNEKGGKFCMYCGKKLNL